MSNLSKVSAYFEFFVEITNTDSNSASIVDYVVKMGDKLLANWDIQN